MAKIAADTEAVRPMERISAARLKHLRKGAAMSDYAGPNGENLGCEIETAGCRIAPGATAFVPMDVFVNRKQVHPHIPWLSPSDSGFKEASEL